jgi:hypothetical protein
MSANGQTVTQVEAKKAYTIDDLYKIIQLQQSTINKLTQEVKIYLTLELFIVLKNYNFDPFFFQSWRKNLNQFRANNTKRPSTNSK